MYVNEYAEVFTLPFGMYLNNATWMLLNYTGVSLLPFAYIIGNSCLKAYAEGQDEGNKGKRAINFIIGDMFAAMVVILLCLNPLGDDISVNFQDNNNFQCSELRAFNPLRRNDAQLGAMQSQYIQNMSAQSSIWWGFIHNFSSVATNSLTAIIPCEQDLSTLKMATATSTFTSRTGQELAQPFINQCYYPAINRANNAGTIQDPQKDTLVTSNAISSQYPSLSATIPSFVWNNYVDSIYDPLITVATAPNGLSVEAPCADLYNVLLNVALNEESQDTERLGIMDTISNLFEQSGVVAERLKAYMGLSSISNPNASTTEVITKYYLENKLGNAAAQTVGYSVDNKLDNLNPVFGATSLLGELGIKAMGAISMVGDYAQAKMIKFISPILISVIQSLVLFLLPIIIVASGYSYKVIATLTMTYITLELSLVLFAIISWIEGVLTYALKSTDNGLAVGISDTALMYLDLSLYIGIPIVFFALMALAGAHTGILSGAAMFQQQLGAKAASAANGAKNLALKLGSGGRI